MSIARPAEGRDKIIGAFDRPGKLVPGNFETRCVTVVTDTKPNKAKASHSAFGCRYLPEFFDSYRIAVRKPGRQTGNGWLIPGSQSQSLGEKPDLRFSQASFLQRAAHAELASGTHPRSEIIEVVHI